MSSYSGRGAPGKNVLSHDASSPSERARQTGLDDRDAIALRPGFGPARDVELAAQACHRQRARDPGELARGSGFAGERVHDRARHHGRGPASAGLERPGARRGAGLGGRGAGRDIDVARAVAERASRAGKAAVATFDRGRQRSVGGGMQDRTACPAARHIARAQVDRLRLPGRRRAAAAREAGQPAGERHPSASRSLLTR
jgi:hypothetical protein